MTAEELFEGIGGISEEALSRVEQTLKSARLGRIMKLTAAGATAAVTVVFALPTVMMVMFGASSSAPNETNGNSTGDVASPVEGGGNYSPAPMEFESFEELYGYLGGGLRVTAEGVSVSDILLRGSTAQLTLEAEGVSAVVSWDTGGNGNERLTEYLIDHPNTSVFGESPEIYVTGSSSVCVIGDYFLKAELPAGAEREAAEKIFGAFKADGEE